MEMDDDIKASADACIERIKIRKAAEKNTFENSVKAIRVWADETYLWLELNDVHIAELIGRVCEAKRPHSVSERSARALS